MPVPTARSPVRGFVKKAVLIVDDPHVVESVAAVFRENAKTGQSSDEFS